MKDKQPVSKEVIIKEYPKSTHWLEGNQVKAIGNLILTNERLIFLNQIILTQEEVEYLQKFSKEATTERLIQLTLTLHKKNFQLPLSSIVSLKMGLYSILPLRPCLRISYRSEKKKKKIKTVSFMFTLPLLKRLLMSEFPTLGWVRDVKKAVKAKQSTA